MFSSLLIANRGEIACRVARTARRMGIATIAVYSEADAGAMHVRAADRAVPIGGAAPRESYLNIARIIEAARATGAQAIHPGYGFLSENPLFVEACDAAGLIFVGPPAAAMRAMGSKAAAKALMADHGVPILPGYHGDNQDPMFLADQAARIGFPVAIKAVAGGGGRGLRVVSDPSDFAAALASACQEGASAFGDDRVLVERYLARPRHIEVQIFADRLGNAVHLFERDCSAQRRHQKVIEEAPAPGLSDADRAAMGRAAVNAAQAVGYVGAGTVEFIADEQGFAFLEMNTRLQVEHPVTEAITGFDLVEWQLRVAAGEALPARQEHIAINGHAFEARLYAEDPARDFAPSIGRLTLFSLPEPGDGLRVDTGFCTGDSVSIHYDAMLAKLICHGPDRATARHLFARAIAACQVVGVASNLDLLHRIARHPDFAAGGIDTGFIAREAATLLAPSTSPPAEILACAALAELAAERAVAPVWAADPHSPWDARDGWWTNLAPEREFSFTFNDEAVPVQARVDGAGWRLRVNERVFLGTVEAEGFRLDGVTWDVRVVADGVTRAARCGGESWLLRLPDPAAFDADDSGGGDYLPAPIPGRVTEVTATAGAHVARGDILVVLEAMKTVFRLPAPRDGVIASVTCAVGDMVTDGQTLVLFVVEG
jgi:3-methylcrotonyl-CoA carboxylase alpha subunit